MAERVYEKTYEIIPKTSTGVWWLVLGMLQGGGEVVEEMERTVRMISLG